MLFTELVKPYAVEFMACRSDCLPASAAMVAAGEWDRDPTWLAAVLRRELRACERGMAEIPEAAYVLQGRGVPAIALHGYDLYSLVEDFHFDGGLVIAVRPSFLYAVPDRGIGHAMVVAKASRLEIPMPRAVFANFLPPIELIDPSPFARTRRRFVSERVERAYDAFGRWALWVPSPGTVADTRMAR